MATLGTSGRTLVVGDVHGCADSLDRLLARTRPTRVVLVGDLFTRGPDPGGVWELIDAWGAEAVLGNHDERVLTRWRPGDRLPRRAFRWLKALPTLLFGTGWAVVHAGVDLGRGLRDTKHRQAVYGTDDPSWWKRWRGDKLVLYGHDARRGLNDRRPYSLGLDTGCVRGGPLTGYLVEQDAIISVERPDPRGW